MSTVPREIRVFRSTTSASLSFLVHSRSNLWRRMNLGDKRPFLKLLRKIDRGDPEYKSERRRNGETDRSRISTMAIRTQWPDKLRNVYQRSRWDLEFKKKGKRKKREERIRFSSPLSLSGKRESFSPFPRKEQLYIIASCSNISFLFLFKKPYAKYPVAPNCYFCIRKKKENPAFSLLTLNKFRNIAFQKIKKKQKS